MPTDAISTINNELREQPLSCPICSENYDNDHIPKVLPCGHTFCHTCIPEFLHISKHCPLCKKPVRGSKDQDFPINFTVNEMIGNKSTTQGFERKWKGVEEGLKKLKTVVDMTANDIVIIRKEMELFVKTCENQVDQLKVRGIEEKKVIEEIEGNIRKACETMCMEQRKLQLNFRSYMKTSIIPANMRYNLEERTNRGAQEIRNRQADRQAQHGGLPVVDQILAGEIRALQDSRRRRLLDSDVVDPTMIALAHPRLLPPARPRAEAQQIPPPLRQPPPIGYLRDPPTPVLPFLGAGVPRYHQTPRPLHQPPLIGWPPATMGRFVPSNSSSADNRGYGNRIQIRGQSSSNNGAPGTQSSVTDRMVLRSATKRPRTEND